jgi:heterotetrameric sarcosine oxidase gamma subunit
MAEFSPIACSPIVQAVPLGLLGGWEVSRRQSSAALRLLDLTACAKILLRGAPNPASSEFLPQFGRAQRVAAGPLILAAIPDQWLLIGTPAAASAIRDWLRSNLNGSPVMLSDLTHARALLRLAGARSAMLLSKICGINLGAASFPCGRVVRSSLAKVTCEIARDDLPSTPGGSFASTTVLSYLIVCDRPAGAYLFDALLDAGREYRIDVDGFSFT